MSDKVKIGLIRKIRACETHNQLDDCITEVEEWKESIIPTSFWARLFEGPISKLDRKLEIAEVDGCIKNMDSFISTKERLMK